MESFIFKDSSHFSRKYHIVSTVGGEHLLDWSINLFRCEVRRLRYKTVTTCMASIRMFHHRYEVTSSQAHIYPQLVLFNEVTIFEAPTRARSVVRANTEARFVSDWPIADAGALLSVLWPITDISAEAESAHLVSIGL